MGTTGRYRENFIRDAPHGLMWEDYQTASSEVFGASFGLGYDTQGITQFLLRGHMGESEYGIGNLIRNFTGNESPYVESDVANKLGAEYGMTFDRPIRQNSLDIKLENKRKELERQSILNRAPHTWTTTGVNLAGGLLASIADPIELASSMIPIVGEARATRITSMLGLGGGRIATGAIEGAVGAGMLEPVRLLMSNEEQTDYSMYDSIANIAFGGIMGGGLHYLSGRLSDRINGVVNQELLNPINEAEAGQLNTMPSRNLYLSERIGMTSADTRLNMMRAALSDALEGREIDIEPILNADPKFNAEVPTFRRVDVTDNLLPLLNVENEQKLFQRMKEDLAVTIDNKFESRQKADTYIREQSKESDISRNNYIVQKTEDGFTVLKAHKASLELDESGSPLKFENASERQNKKSAEKYAAQKNLGKDPSDVVKYHAVAMKNKSGDVSYAVVKGVSLSANDLENIKNNSVFLAADKVLAIEKSKVDLSEIIKSFAEKKSKPQSHFLKNVEVTPEPKKMDARQEFDKMFSEVENSKYDFEKIIDSFDDESLDKSSFAKEISDMKKIDADYEEFRSMEQKIMALADCMGG